MRRLLRISVATAFGVLIAVAVIAFVHCSEIRKYRTHRQMAELMAAAEHAPPLGEGNPPSPESFRPVPLLPRQPPITDFPVVAAANAAERLRDDELVLGVEIDGETRAYPLNMLNGPMREILNDTLGDRAIAVTWCHLCHNGIVYSRQAKGQTLTLAVSGMLWGHNLVMVDEQTDSLWCHMLGEAMRGPLTGERLELLPAVMTDWKTWHDAHPQTTVAMLPRSARWLQRDAYRELDRYAIGLSHGDSARAWRFDHLLAAPVVNDRVGDTAVLVVFDQASMTPIVYERTIDRRTIDFEVQEGNLVDPQTGASWDLLTGHAITADRPHLTRLPGFVSFTHSWKRFRPQTTIWQPN